MTETRTEWRVAYRAPGNLACVSPECWDCDEPAGFDSLELAEELAARLKKRRRTFIRIQSRQVTDWEDVG